MFYNLSATPDPTLTQSTTSTSWQPLDTTFTAGDTILRIYAVGASGNWVEIDDLYLSLES